MFATAVALKLGGENSVAGPIPILLGAGPWWYGVIDAHNAAARYNHGHATNEADVQVHPVMVVGANGTVSVGIAMALAY